MNPQLSVPQEQLSAFCQRHGIRWLALFGSALRDDFGPESDIDVLVEFEPEHIPGLIGLARIQLELCTFFPGRNVDLRTPDDLSPYFRQDVLDSAEVRYVQE